MVGRRSFLGVIGFKQIISLWQSWQRLFDDLIFPIHCIKCNKEGDWLCVECRRTVPIVPLQACPFCKMPTAYGITCEVDRKSHSLDGATVRGVYQDWVWQDIVKGWKFDGVVDLGKYATEMLCEALPHLPHGLYNPIVVSVPLTKRRQRWRGFNQAYTLASAVAGVIEGEIIDGVLRIRDTRPQPGLGKTQRRQNVHGAFEVVGDVRDRDCIIVDDLLTTGATMDEIARVLKQAGAKKVWGVTLVRGALVP